MMTLMREAKSLIVSTYIYVKLQDSCALKKLSNVSQQHYILFVFYAKDIFVNLNLRSWRRSCRRRRRRRC